MIDKHSDRSAPQIRKAYGSKVNVTIREFPHSWGQNTIIARFEPTAEAKHGDAPIVLLSAHQDSTNSLPFLRAPGADDDGAGVGVLVSVFTALLRSGYTPRSSALELHFYSAEEGGLLGSGEVSKAYVDRGAAIRSVYHMDVVAFHKKGTEERIGVISDNVDEDLTNLMRRLVREFADIDYVDTKCGYGCSVSVEESESIHRCHLLIFGHPAGPCKPRQPGSVTQRCLRNGPEPTMLPV